MLANQAFKKAVTDTGKPQAYVLGIERADGSLSRYETVVFPDDHPRSAENLMYIERLVKFLLWQRGGWRIYAGGSQVIGEYLQNAYSPSGSRAFDYTFMGERVFQRTFTVTPCKVVDVPPNCEHEVSLGRHLEGYRIGFDLGASDIKVSAVVNGKAIFSTEIEWEPGKQTDSRYHYEKIKAALNLAASKMPKIDAIGGSSAGIYINNRPMVAPLFRGIPAERFDEIRNMFQRISDEFSKPLVIVNDGEVTALAGSMSLNDNSVLAQKIINRIVFIRMCEDRGIEGEERLRKVASKKNLVELRKLFKELDDRYNTGLFDNTNDPLQTHYGISSQLFLDIVEELYFPKAPYSFSVLDADFLGQVYELFLVKRLALDGSGIIILQDKPAYEGREIIATPQPLVGEIVRRTLSGRLAEMRKAGPVSFEDLKELRVIDVAAGSGRFLLRSLDELVDAAIDVFRTTGDTTYIYKRMENDYRLSFQAKKELLRLCLFGIDIDYNAVEVARFSLLVKLLEDENQATLPTGKKILPNLDSNIVWGNSVVGEDFSHPDQAVIELTRPMDWDAARLPSEFDAVVGNPPYVKTEEMKSKTPDEFAYYKRTYTTPFKQFVNSRPMCTSHSRIDVYHQNECGWG